MVTLLSLLPFAMSNPQSGTVILTDVPEPILLYNLNGYPIHDDGQGVDRHAGDEIYSVFIPDPGGLSCFVELRSTQNFPLWQGEVPCPMQTDIVWIGLHTEGDSIRADIQQQSFTSDAPKPRNWIWGLVAVGLLVIYRLARRHTALFRKKDIPAEFFRYQYHDKTPKEEQLMEHIQRLLPYAQIILCPSPERVLDALDGLPGLYILPQQKRTRNAILKLELGKLREEGPAYLLIDGLDALEAPKGHQTRESVLEDLGRVIYMEERPVPKD
ncbi:MAG: hypothetical protein VX278_13090 [Myxococcota bacterium]|nr:hypothetical protein [Myxococcota bacterium]